MRRQHEARWVVPRPDGEEPYTLEDLPTITVPLYSLSYAGFRRALKEGLLGLRKQGAFKSNKRRSRYNQVGLLGFSGQKDEASRDFNLSGITLGNKQTASSIDGGAPKARRTSLDY